jgi:hypothetical protein
MIDILKLRPLKPCPFCGADAALTWIMGSGGKGIRASCSREGECPSPTWDEPTGEHENDAACLDSVVTFWNTRADDWQPEELMALQVKFAKLEQELRVTRIERDRAIKACEQIAATIDGGKA